MMQLKNDIISNGYTSSFDGLVHIFDNLPDMIILILDERLNIAFANKAISKILNLQRRQVIGKHVDILKKKISGISDLLDRTIRQKKEVRNNLLELSQSNGMENKFLVSTVFIRAWEKTKEGIILVFHDVSGTMGPKGNDRTSDRYGEIVGASENMKALYLSIEKIKHYDTSILISGETGTGKDLIARTIHLAGKRKEKPFVPVNCAALSNNLIESELFGHVKGAYTGATIDRPGRFKTADGGALFLDEIGTLQMDTQTKLLRVLQEKVIEPVGSDERICVDVRIISATNRDLLILAQKEIFRLDLYYRLKVLQIDVPPLRERGQDIILLSNHFIKRLNRYYRNNILGLTDHTKQTLMHYAWPGNVRELENAIEHAFVLSTGPYLEVKDLPPEIRLADEYGVPPPPLINSPAQEEENIKRALLSAGGNKDRAAEILSMHRTTLWRKLKEYQIPKSFGKKK